KRRIASGARRQAGRLKLQRARWPDPGLAADVRFRQAGAAEWDRQSSGADARAAREGGFPEESAARWGFWHRVSAIYERRDANQREQAEYRRTGSGRSDR